MGRRGRLRPLCACSTTQHAVRCRALCLDTAGRAQHAARAQHTKHCVYAPRSPPSITASFVSNRTKCLRIRWNSPLAGTPRLDRFESARFLWPTQIVQTARAASQVLCHHHQHHHQCFSSVSVARSLALSIVVGSRTGQGAALLLLLRRRAAAGPPAAPRLAAASAAATTTRRRAARLATAAAAAAAAAMPPQQGKRAILWFRKVRAR